MRRIIMLLFLVSISCCDHDESTATLEEKKSNEAQLLKLELTSKGNTYNTVINKTDVSISNNLPFGTEELTIKTIQISDKASVNKKVGDKINLNENTTLIKVTAEDGTIITYKLQIKVAEGSSSANLTKLELEFNKTIYKTEINGTEISISKPLPKGTTEVSIKTIHFSENATSNIIQGEKLKVNLSPIEIEITSQNKKTVNKYSLTLETESCATLPFGVNLAGAEFAGNLPGVYNSDYTYPTNEELDYFNSKGLRLIRLPFKWERLQPVLGGDLNTTELNRIKLFLKSAKERNMLVILDLHNYGRYKLNGKEEIIGSTNVTISHIKDLWKKLAAAVENRSEIWGYGIMNEPHDMLTSTPWFSIAQSIIDGIRQSDNNTRIIVGGDSWSSAERWINVSDNLKNLQDPSNNLVFEAHVYFDKDASGTYNNSYDNEGANPYTGVNRVKPFIEWLQNNNLQGFIGEYGIPSNDTRWLTVLDNFLKYLEDNCVNGTYWAAGPWWGDYILSIEPKNGKDKPQMSILEKHLTTK